MSANIQLELVKEDSGYVEIEIFVSPEHVSNNANQPKLEGHPSEEGSACISDEVLVKEEPISVIEESGCMDVEEVCAEDDKYEVKEEVELGPELLQRPREATLDTGMKPPGDCRQRQELGLVKVEPPEHSPQPGGVRTLYMHIKEEPMETSLVHDVKEEVLCVDEGELQSSGLPGVSAAAMLAALYTDHTVKDELLLGPELLHRPSVTQSDRAMFSDTGVAEALGRRCSVRPERLLLDAGVAGALGRRCSVRPERLLLDAGVAEALGRRCSVRLERLLLDAERRACRVGRRTYRLRPESEPRRAATPATDTYRCHHCDKAFGHKSVLSEHIHTHLSTGLAHSRCSTREDSNSDRHQKLLTRVKPFKCNLKGKLRGHESTHTGGNPFHCKYCDYKCSRKGNLRRHEIKHSGEKPFQCSHCDYKCCHKESLRRHGMKHAGLKPFKCNYCDYKCYVKGELRRHEMTHTGEKPFQCNYCDYKCCQRGHLRSHEMTHTGVKPFKCNYCDYKCSQKGNLRSHEMTHTGENRLSKCKQV